MISDITKKDFFQLKFSQSDEKADKTTIVHIIVVFGTFYHAYCPRVY